MTLLLDAYPRSRILDSLAKEGGPDQLVALLAHQLELGQWGPVMHVMHLANFMAQCKPYMAKQLAANGAPRVLMAVMKDILIANEGPDATEMIMGKASEMLLYLVETDQAECNADILTADSVTVLLKVLTSAASGTAARQHVARLLRRVVASGPAWRGPLLAHGGIEGLSRALQDPVAACDLLYLQEVLWALVGLVDAAVTGGSQLGSPHLVVGTLVPLLHLLTLPEMAHHSHIMALVIRCLHVLATGDDVSKQELGSHGIIQLLIQAIRIQRHDELAEWDAQHSSAPGATKRLPAGDGEAKTEPLVPANVSAWTRLMAVLIIQAACDPRAPSEPGTPTAGQTVAALPAATAISSSAMACYGLLMPLLMDDHTPDNEKKSIVMESVVAIKALVCDSLENQDVAVTAGAVPVLVHLVSQGDIMLAWQAADALSNFNNPNHAPVLLTNGVVEELTLLLQESGDALHLMTVRRQLEEHAISGSVSSLPTPNAAYARRGHKKQQPRIQLVGRHRLSFSGSTCMYTNHDQYFICDYCVPSACLRTLLRLFGSAHLLPQQPPASGASGPARFVSMGGLYAMFLLLHHELAGVHHSKMASSLVSLLNLVLDAGVDIQDEVRKVGGLALLVSLMESLARPQGVTDIYQLRVQLCVALSRLVEGNEANKLLVRERGLIQLLAGMLQSVLDPASSQVLDDREQVTKMVLDVLGACIADNQGNQEALVNVGGLRHINQILTQATLGVTSSSKLPNGGAAKQAVNRAGTPVLAAAVRTMGFLIQHQAAQLLLLGGTVLPVLVHIAEQEPMGQVAQCLAFMCVQMLNLNPGAKGYVIGSGLLPLLLAMLTSEPVGPQVAAASQGLYALCVGDVDQQNEVVSQNGLLTIERLVQGNTPFSVHALWLLCCLLHGNSYVRNALRQQCPGISRLLLRILQAQALKQPDLAIAASHALAQMCQSNHTNQELLAEEGGLEAVYEVLRCLLHSTPAETTPAALEATPSSQQQPASPRSSVDGGEGSEPEVVSIEGLGVAVANQGVLEAVLRFLAALLEFNSSNQKLVRESGCLSQVALLLLRAAGVSNLSVLRRAGLLPSVAAACTVIARAAQDCRDNQERLVTGHEDLAPALFRLLSIDEPYVALEAALALEHMVIRTDLVHDQKEDRADFESDAIRSLVQVLHTRGGVASSSAAGSLPSNVAAAMSNGFWGTGTSRTSLSGADAAVVHASVMTSGSVREAGSVLSALVSAAAAAAESALAAGPDAARSGGSITSIGTSAPPPKPVEAAPKKSAFSRLFWRRQNNNAAGSGTGGQVDEAEAAALAANIAAAAVAAVVAQAVERGETPPVRSSELPFEGADMTRGLSELSVDHASGLLTAPSLQGVTMTHEQWLRLAGQSAGAFQPIAKLITESVWRPVKVQLSWLLFLLAARSPANRDLVGKLERSVVNPLAAQLANAETFFASAQAAEALAAAESTTAAPLPVSIMPHDTVHPSPRSTPTADATLASPSHSNALPTSTTTSPALPISSQPASRPAAASAKVSSDGKPVSPAQGPLPASLSGVQAAGKQPVAGGQQSQGAEERVNGTGSTPSKHLPPGHADEDGDDDEDDDDLDYVRQEVAMLAGLSGAQAPPPPSSNSDAEEE